jgi:hypothetical protein
MSSTKLQAILNTHVLPNRLDELNTKEIFDLLQQYLILGNDQYYDQTLPGVNDYIIVGINRLTIELTSRYLLLSL